MSAFVLCEWSKNKIFMKKDIFFTLYKLHDINDVNALRKNKQYYNIILSIDKKLQNYII